jgi:transglutaminase-like putative cysteine protease
LKKKYEYIISIEKDQLKGICNVEEQKIINKETGINHNSKEISINSFTEANNIKAFTLIPKNKKYIKKAVEKIELQDDLSGYAFYDDQKSYKFVYPSVQIGAILDLKYQLNYKELRFIGSHYWSDYIPTYENELIVRVQNNIHIAYKLFNCEGIDLEFTKGEGKHETVYRWKRKNAPSIFQYDNAPDFRYYEPHILFYVTDYEIKGKSNHLLGSTKDLYSWYCSLLKNVNKTEDQQLKNIVDSLVSGITEEKEKVKKIFYWVQDNISYVAFEDGLGGFIPRDAGMVCERKFGDCKDMASIICEMLRFAGINAYHTWLGSRDIPYEYTDVSTPYVDNHMIASYKDKEGNWNFLDATGKKAPIDLFTSMIQGKEALIGISCDSFLIVSVPIKDTSVNQTIDSITIEIKDKSIFGKGKAKLTGYNGLHYLYRTDRLGKEEYQDFFKNYFSKGSNKVSFDEVTKPIGDRGDINISYNFKLNDYVKYNQQDIYINLNMNNNSLLVTLPEDRKAPLDFTHKTKKTLVTTLIIPEGYQPEYIPENGSYSNKVAGYSSTYRLNNNKIIYTLDFYTNFLLLPISDFELYNKVINEQIKANKQMVSLLKNK